MMRQADTHSRPETLAALSLLVSLFVCAARPAVALVPLPSARTGVAPFAVAFGDRVPNPAAVASLMQLVTDPWEGNLAVMRNANPSAPLLAYIHTQIFTVSPWFAETQPHETAFLHTSDPASLTAVSSRGTVTLAWLADARIGLGVLDGTGYNVYRRRGSAGPFHLLTPSPIASATFADSGLADGVLVSYEVTSVDRTLGEVAYSGVVTAAPGATTLPSLTPASLTVATTGTGVSITIVVQASEGIDGVDLWLDRDRSRTFSDTEMTTMAPAGTDGMGHTRFSATVPVTQIKNGLEPAGYAWYVETATGSPDARLPVSGVFTTNVNNRIRSQWWGYWFMDPADTTWQRILANAASGLVAQGYDGVFVDEALTSPYDYGPDSAPQRAVVSRWQAGIQSLLAAVKAAIAPASVVFNSLQTTSLGYLDVSDGVMIEGFVANMWTANGAIDDQWSLWQRFMDTSLRAEVTRNSTQLFYSYGPDTAVDLRLYSLASYLLLKNEHAFFAYAEGTTKPGYYPEWDVAIGEPVESFSQVADAKRPSGLYGRSFEGGLVLVNPSHTATFTETLPASMAQLNPTGGAIPALGGDGQMSASWVRTVTLAPRTGAILLTSWTGETGMPAQSPSAPSIAPAPVLAPLGLSLAPNPARGNLTISAGLSAAGRVRVDIYDAGGRHVSRVLDHMAPEGGLRETVNTDALGLKPGVYAVVADLPSGVRTKKLVVAP